MQFSGIDVSKWNGDIDWVKVKNSGKVEFAIIHTGYGREGTNQIDPKFKQNITGAKANGIKTGCYHYSYAESPEDAINEAEFCLSIVDGEKLDLPIYYDIEDKSISDKHNKNVRTQMCINFCTRIKQAGYQAGVYANKNWFDNYINYDELNNLYTLWLAQWGVDKPAYDCDVWQYSETGQIDGISGDVDLDYMFKDLSVVDTIDKTPLSEFITSVTDRKLDDVNKLQALMRKGYNSFTDEEKTIWAQDNKGALNASDMNRITNNSYILGKCLGLEIDKHTYYNGDFLRTTDFDTLSGNLQKVIDELRKNSTEDIPEIPNKPFNDYIKINLIEEIQYKIYNIINNM